MTLTTTLNRIRAHSPCEDGWKKLLAGLGKTQADDELLPYARIVEINGIKDALWCCYAEPRYDRQWRLFAVWCVRQVQHLMTDPRSLAALDVAERYANGAATDDELNAACDAARDAAWDAAWGAAATAAWNVTATDASDAVWDASFNSAMGITWDALAAEFLRVVNGGGQ